MQKYINSVDTLWCMYIFYIKLNEVIRKYKLDNIKRKLIHPKFKLVIKKNTRNTLQEMQESYKFYRTRCF